MTIINYNRNSDIFIKSNSRECFSNENHSDKQNRYATGVHVVDVGQ